MLKKAVLFVTKKKTAILKEIAASLNIYFIKISEPKDFVINENL
jgi:hypothetical protein